MKKVEITKCNEMIYKISIDGETYEYTGTYEGALKVKKNLDFVLNLKEEE